MLAAADDTRDDYDLKVRKAQHRSQHSSSRQHEVAKTQNIGSVAGEREINDPDRPGFFFKLLTSNSFHLHESPQKKNTPKSNWESIITPFASRNIVIIAWSRFSPNSRFLPLLILLLNHWFIIIHRRSISFLAEGSEQLFDWENEALIGFRAYQQPRIAREQILFRRSRRQFSPAQSTSALFGTVFD